MTTATTKVSMPVHLLNWVAEHRDELKPPVGNKYLYEGNAFFVMVVAAAEVTIGLAIAVLLFKKQDSVDTNEITLMKG